MAPKRLLQEPPPAASSSTEDEVEESENDAVEEEANGVSDDEETEDDEEDEEEEDDHRNRNPTNNRSTVITSSKASQRQSSSDSGDGSGEESDSESNKTHPSPSVSDFTIKPIVSKPMDDSGKPQNNAAKRNLAPAPATAISSGLKRANESNMEGKESKKKKVPDGQDEDIKKGSGVQRLWSEDDEIAILKGMIDYQSKKRADPCAEMVVFLDFIKNNLHAEVSKNQLMNKIRRLKKKFQTNAEKSENGENPVFSKPHDHKFFELSKKIWGSAATNGVDKRKRTQSKGKSSALVTPKLEMVVKKKEEPNGELNPGPAKSCSNSSLDGLLASGKFFSQPEATMNAMKEAMPLIGSSKAKELERKWRELQDDECLLYLKKIELIHESTKLLLDARKSSSGHV